VLGWAAFVFCCWRILVKFQSPGPVFLRQRGSGSYREFGFASIPNMRPDADRSARVLEQSPDFASSETSNSRRSITPSAVLSPLSLMNFPVLNVLRGQMSDGGPRRSSERCSNATETDGYVLAVRLASEASCRCPVEPPLLPEARSGLMSARRRQPSARSRYSSAHGVIVCHWTGASTGGRTCQRGSAGQGLNNQALQRCQRQDSLNPA